VVVQTAALQVPLVVLVLLTLVVAVAGLVAVQLVLPVVQVGQGLLYYQYQQLTIEVMLTCQVHTDIILVEQIQY
jgi:hypothetical protein